MEYEFVGSVPTGGDSETEFGGQGREVVDPNYRWIYRLRHVLLPFSIAGGEGGPTLCFGVPDP